MPQAILTTVSDTLESTDSLIQVGAMLRHAYGPTVSCNLLDGLLSKIDKLHKHDESTDKIGNTQLIIDELLISNNI